jgi:hypothetical protein
LFSPLLSYLEKVPEKHKGREDKRKKSSFSSLAIAMIVSSSDRMPEANGMKEVTKKSPYERAKTRGSGCGEMLLSYGPKKKKLCAKPFPSSVQQSLIS